MFYLLLGNVASTRSRVFLKIPREDEKIHYKLFHNPNKPFKRNTHPMPHLRFWNP